MSNPAPPTQTGGSKAFLLVAVILGVLATAMAFVFIKNGGSDSGNEILIVVAKHDLTPATPIDPDRDLEQMKIPAKFASLIPRTLSWDGRGAYKGERVNRDVFQGQYILLADLAAVANFEQLKDPYRALTIPAETAMVIPGDNVKIMVARPSAGSTPGVPLESGHLPYDATIIGTNEGYRVLAVGGSSFRTRQMAMMAEQFTTSSSSVKSVTLRVTEAQAKEIISALGPVGTNNQKAILLMCPSENAAGGVTVTPPTSSPGGPGRRGP